jgi:hypothetical protein
MAAVVATNEELMIATDTAEIASALRPAHGAPAPVVEPMLGSVPGVPGTPPPPEHAGCNGAGAVLA